MKARASTSHCVGVSGLGCLATVLVLLAPCVARAQGESPAAKANTSAPADDEEEEGEEDRAPAPAPESEKPTAKTDAPAQPVSTDVATAIAPAAEEGTTLAQDDNQLEQPNGLRHTPSTDVLQWHGGLEADTTYAGYSDQGTDRPMAFYDLRGRFVVGPTLEHRFGEHKDWFVAARGELVAWLRDGTTYQVNADDVYGQVGQKGVWDLKLGRFRSWRVYHKGAGFDLYTIEDQGACTSGSLSTGSCSLESGVFGPHTYEVSYNYYREPAGKAAFHVSPTPWSGLELTGVMGNSGVFNQLGGRGAGLLHFDFLRVSAAAEYRLTKPGQEQAATCPNCGVSRYYGFGGGAELTLAPVSIGVNAAQGHETKYSATNGTLDPDASATVTSLGGYAEVDVGSLAFDRGLILGFGLNRTEVVDRVDNFEQHYQGAAYALFPLGFNEASLKVVVSQATLDILSSKGDGTAMQLPTSTMRTARLRFSYPF